MSRTYHLDDILKELDAKLRQNWSVEYQDWIMLVIEGAYKEFKYYHVCQEPAQFTTPVIRICETCKTVMPDSVWDHFLKTRQFMFPPRSPIDDALGALKDAIEQVRSEWKS